MRFEIRDNIIILQEGERPFNNENRMISKFLSRRFATYQIKYARHIRTGGGDFLRTRIETIP